MTEITLQRKEQLRRELMAILERRFAGGEQRVDLADLAAEFASAATFAVGEPSGIEVGDLVEDLLRASNTDPTDIKPKGY